MLSHTYAYCMYMLEWVIFVLEIFIVGVLCFISFAIQLEEHLPKIPPGPATVTYTVLLLYTINCVGIQTYEPSKFDNVWKIYRLFMY